MCAWSLDSLHGGCKNLEGLNIFHGNILPFLVGGVLGNNIVESKSVDPGGGGGRFRGGSRRGGVVMRADPVREWVTLMGMSRSPLPPHTHIFVFIP